MLPFLVCLWGFQKIFIRQQLVSFFLKTSVSKYWYYYYGKRYHIYSCYGLMAYVLLLKPTPIFL